MRLVVLSLLLVAVSSSAQTLSSNVSNERGRSVTSLDGTWSTIVDPYETGLQSRYYENAKPTDKSALAEYDFDRSPKLHVPGDWNTQRAELLFYEGTVWYQRYFSYSKRPHRRTFLDFGAANYHTRVWLNGNKLGEHVGGFTPFEFEVTDKLANGENSLVVEVKNTRLADGVPALRTDWWNYGGITRSVRLVEVPGTFIEHYSLHLVKNSSEQIEGSLNVTGGYGRESVTVEIPEIHLKQTVQTDSSGGAEFRFSAKPELWSPEHPKLYRVVISTADESITDEIGFCALETRGTQILLNETPIFLRGISLHEEAPFRSGRAFSEEDDRTLLTWAKELGCNFVRLAHYPHNEEMIRLADHMGLVVWEEVPVYWSIDWQNPNTLENAKSQMREVIARDHNRASVFFWSLSNETPPQESGRLDFLKALAAYTRQLDATRLITSAMDRTDPAGPDTRSLNDPLGEVLDVLGLNEYIGWYVGRTEDADRAQWQTRYQKPLIVSEFGADALYNFHADADTRFSEEYQATLFQHQIAMLRRMPSLAGVSPWLLMDFHSPRRPLPGIQDYYNRKGLISDRGQRKQAFYVLQEFYRQKTGEQAAAGNQHR